MNVKDPLKLMQFFSIISLVICLHFSYVINNPEESLFIDGFNVVTESVGHSDVFTFYDFTIIFSMFLGIVMGSVFAIAHYHSQRTFNLILFILLSILIILSYESGNDRIPIESETLHQFALWIFLGLPLMIGIPSVINSNLELLALSAFLVVVIPLGSQGNDTSMIVEILCFISAFLLFIELGYGHERYSRLSKIIPEGSNSVVNWFVMVLMVTLFIAVGMTTAAYYFHEVMAYILPLKFAESIEFNTIYGRAISVLLFFSFWAAGQILLSRSYLAQQVED